MGYFTLIQHDSLFCFYHCLWDLHLSTGKCNLQCFGCPQRTWRLFSFFVCELLLCFPPAEGCLWQRAGWQSPSFWVMLQASTWRRPSPAQFAMSPGLPCSKLMLYVKCQAIALADYCLGFFNFLIFLLVQQLFPLSVSLGLDAALTCIS